jgi:hypothetical protein
MILAYSTYSADKHSLPQVWNTADRSRPNRERTTACHEVLGRTVRRRISSNHTTSSPSATWARRQGKGGVNVKGTGKQRLPRRSTIKVSHKYKAVHTSFEPSLRLYPDLFCLSSPLHSPTPRHATSPHLHLAFPVTPTLLPNPVSATVPTPLCPLPLNVPPTVTLLLYVTPPQERLCRCTSAHGPGI